MNWTSKILLYCAILVIAACNGGESTISKPMELYVSVTAIDTASSIGIQHVGKSAPYVEYSLDGNSWTRLSDQKDVQLKAGQSVRLRGNNPRGFSYDINKYSSLVFDGKVKIAGNIMSLINYTRVVDTIPCEFCFYGLFYDNKAIVEVADSLLPAKVLKDGCYFGMFGNCQNLTKAPMLPAKDLQNGCYSCMFKNCVKLSRIKAAFSKWDSVANPTEFWCLNVSDSGVFECRSYLDMRFGGSNIPQTWKVITY